MANFLRKVRKNQAKRKLNVSTGAFDPQLNIQSFMNMFSVKYPKLENIYYKLKGSSEEALYHEDIIQDIKMFLAEDHMFTSETWDIAQKYTKIVNEMGGILLPKEVEEKFSDEELKQYYTQNFKIYMYINMYYRLFFGNLLMNIGNNLEMENLHRDKIAEVVFPEYKKFYKNYVDLVLNIGADVIPEYVTMLAADEANQFIVDYTNGKKHNSKLIFKYGITKERGNISNEVLYENAKNLLGIVSEFK